MNDHIPNMEISVNWPLARYYQSAKGKNTQRMCVSQDKNLEWLVIATVN